jgi:hypothetical protein
MRGKEITLEFENPEESGYYASIGRINLYDLTAIAKEDDKSLEQYFNTLPMCIMEVNGTRARYNRCNRSFREFMHRTMAMHYDTEEIDCGNLSGGPAAAFLKTVVRCGRDGGRMILDEKGKVERIYSAFDAGKVVNPISIQGQIEGGAVMGMGYALTEDFPLEDCRPKARFGTLGLLRATQVPQIKAIYVEKDELMGVSYGSKGIGEITTIPIAPAIAGAYYAKDHRLRRKLPMEHTWYRP